jgi:hypothetical protein
MPILQGFQRYPEEGALIGRMLIGYADLEIDLMHCAKSVRGDLDLPLKTMFRGRGNKQRIDVADAIARHSYAELHLENEFVAALQSMRHCLKIRNLYAHCIWWDDHSGQLAFANLENLANQDTKVDDLQALPVNHVTIRHLEAQLAYFQHSDAMLIGVIQEGNRRAGRPAHPGVVIPQYLAPPPVTM